MISRYKEKFVSFFNSQSSRVIASSLFDRRRLQMQNQALHSHEPGVTDHLYFDNKKIIVSLTTYGKRLYDVFLTIESIMQQTAKPNIIILWLANDISYYDIPEILKKQEQRGLEIKQCDDLKSYKKLIPSLKSFPNDYIITVDDDVIYQYDMVENLIKSYIKEPGFVYANRMRRIIQIADKRIDNYHNWPIVKDSMTDSPLNFPTGVGGVLYPPNCFSQEVFNEKTFMSICEYADDVWFKTMCLINGFHSRLALIHEPVYYENESVQDIALYNKNINDSLNDKQIAAVFEKYNVYNLFNR